VHSEYYSLYVKEESTWKILQVVGDIEMDITEIGNKGVDWIHVAQDAVQWQTPVNKGICLCVALKVGCILSSFVTVSQKVLYCMK
jgi:hypothetical protein